MPHPIPINHPSNAAKCPVVSNCITPAFTLFCLLVLFGWGCAKHNLTKKNEASLPELNRALAIWTMQRGAYPKEVDDLTNLPALLGKQLPQPPAGQKLVMDPVSHLIVITNE
jgi:hypothetical protein